MTVRGRGLAEDGRRGAGGLIEFPITVTPILRLPFFATFLVATGVQLFKVSFRTLKTLKRPLQFQFHLSDFVDYGHSDLADQVPRDGTGLYIPHALRMSLEKKLEIFKNVMDMLVQEYCFVTLEEWGNQLKI